MQRSELRNAWEVVVFVDVEVKTAVERGTLRDANQLGGIEATEALYRDRYAPAFEMYERLSQPLQNANIVLNNTDFETATVRIVRPV